MLDKIIGKKHEEKLVVTPAPVEPKKFSPEELAALVKANNLRADSRDIADYEWQDMPWLWVPRELDLSMYLLGIEDQSVQGSCVAHAGTSMLEADEKATTGNSIQRSRRHLYWNARSFSAVTEGVDGGTTLRDALKAMYHKGVCTEATCPYDNSLVNVAPLPSADAEGANYKVTEYRRLKGLSSQDVFVTIRRIQEAIATGHLIMYASQIEQDYFYLGNNGPHYSYQGLSKPGAVNVGGHAQTLCGYKWKGSEDWGKLANSWNTTWGENGFSRIRLTTLANDATDIWAVRSWNGKDVMARFNNRKKIAQLYVSIFGRAPDAGGMDYWVGQLEGGMPATTIANTMFAVEPARAYYPSGMTNSQIVASFYQNVLGRPADEGGLAYWTGIMNAQGFGAAVTQIIAIVETYTGTDSAVRASCQLFADKVGQAMTWAANGGGVTGSDAAIVVVG